MFWKFYSPVTRCDSKFLSYMTFSLSQTVYSKILQWMISSHNGLETSNFWTCETKFLVEVPISVPFIVNMNVTKNHFDTFGTLIHPNAFAAGGSFWKKRCLKPSHKKEGPALRTREGSTVFNLGGLNYTGFKT